MDTIIHQAKLLAGNKAIDDEHLFMAILMNPSSIACSILVDLGLDIESLIFRC
ncbi:MAG: Clp protease N-terminal domain-containing protein [Clostridium sp.]|nr:MAG: Clp protease N-terminal domain-containing protein [Clostridium sp.]